MKAVQKTSPDPFTYHLNKLQREGVPTEAEITVRAYASATPGVIVTQTVKPRIAGGLFKLYANRWSITHAETGFRMDNFERGVPLEQARLIAGAFGGFPVDWQLPTREAIAKQWAGVPLDLKKWVTELKDERWPLA